MKIRSIAIACALLVAPASADAGPLRAIGRAVFHPFRAMHHATPSCQHVAPAPYHTPAPAPYHYAPAPAPAAAGYDGPGEFLAALNAWRASHGRHPVGWDSGLAAYASTNAGVHQPGSSGGGSQCWAGVGGYLRSLEMWKNSPAHAAILLGANSAVGASACPTGMTCNAR